MWKEKCGVKHDSGKPQWHLLRGMFQAVDEVMRVRAFGVEKYKDPDNWLNVEDGERRYTEAAIRHFTAALDGKERDEESGLLHLAHGSCSALFALAFALKRAEP
jgi:Domain of unknown function (DUF5664)